MVAPPVLCRSLAAAARLVRGCPQVFASLATGPRGNNAIFYEIRTYDVKPSKMKEFVELVYNFAHRSAVRHALTNDKEWQRQFISPALPLIEKQHNEVAYLVPWCQLGKPPREGGVYEWVTFQMKPGGPALWGEAFQAAINAHINTGYTRLIGVFHTEYGLLNTVHVIWWNESSDHCVEGRRRAHEDARVVAAVRDSVRFLESQQNMLLTPLACSPLK
ncbi:UNVERIFIED_CONTAM: hypothetical protein H355_007409 [Colinus virginianus]|nr:hypothetical protein H355_007409 [Colinus virginianus]